MDIAAVLTKVRDARAQSIVLRRGAATLSAQSFRVERMSKGAAYRDEAARERRSDVILLGAVNADIAIDDRFNADGGLLYRVNFIQPNRTYATMAEAVVVN